MWSVCTCKSLSHQCPYFSKPRALLGPRWHPQSPKRQNLANSQTRNITANPRDTMRPRSSRNNVTPQPFHNITQQQPSSGIQHDFYGLRPGIVHHRFDAPAAAWQNDSIPDSLLEADSVSTGSSLMTQEELQTSEQARWAGYRNDPVMSQGISLHCQHRENLARCG